MKNIYLLQLTAPLIDSSTGTEMSSNKSAFLPYSVGLLWSYCLQNKIISDNFILKDLVFNIDNLDYYIDNMGQPDIVATSNYMWNSNKHLYILKKIKKKYPNCLIICGGPHVPNSNDSKWYNSHDYVDIGVVGEGEKVFEQILLEYFNKKDFSEIPGLIFRKNNKIFKTMPATRIKDINTIPSPYLSGLFNNIILKNPSVNFHATVEMDRGCPFKCTFCDWGSLTAQKMIKFDEPRLFKEFEWVSRNKINYLWFTNSNLGIFKERDYNIIDKAVGYHEATGYPKKIAHSGYAKTPPSKNSSLQIQQRLLEGVENNNTVPRVALQSTNPEVLSNIKRKNMSIVNADKMDSTEREVELIYPLPGTTYDGWVDELSALMPVKKLKINVYPCLILPNAELNDKSYKERFKIKTKIIPFNVDMEECEIITSLKSMSYEDVVKGWMFAWIVMNFWFEPILKYIYYDYLKDEVTLKDFFVKFQDYLESDPIFITSKFQDMQTTTIGELYNQIKNNIHNTYDDYDHVVDSTRSIKYLRQNIILVLKDIENFISIYFNKHIHNLSAGYGRLHPNRFGNSMVCGNRLLNDDDLLIILEFLVECSYSRYNNNVSLKSIKYNEAKWVGTFIGSTLISMSGVKWEEELKGYRLLFRGASLPGYVKKVSKDITQSSYQWSHINIQKEITGGVGPYYLTNNVDSKTGVRSYKFSNIMKKLSQKGVVDLVECKIFNNVKQNIWRYNL